MKEAKVTHGGHKGNNFLTPRVTKHHTRLLIECMPLLFFWHFLENQTFVGVRGAKQS